MQAASVHQPALIEAAWPKRGIISEVLLVLAGTVLLSLAAQIQLLLPISPVPITGQTFAVLLLGALFGRKRGPATVLTYLGLGGLGFPIFAGGAAGIAKLAGPTAGYLLGFPAAAFLVGALAERGWDRRPSTTAAGMVLGNLVIYSAGALWLSTFVGWNQVLQAGVIPFLVGDALKIALATFLLPTAWRLVGQRIT